MLGNLLNVHNSMPSSSNFTGKNRPNATNLSRLLTRIRQQFLPLATRPGVHTSSHLMAMGFKYTGNRDTARCDDCGLEVSGWTLDMNPWTVHSTQSPNCSFVRSLRPIPLSNEFSSLPRSTAIKRNRSPISGQENLAKRRKTEIISLESPLRTSVEDDACREARKRTFDHWPYSSTPSIEQLFRAGFAACNVGDRVICPCCDLTCHRWTRHVDEACEVHKAFSPQCQYVKEKLLNTEQPRIVNDDRSSNSASANNPLYARNTTDIHRCIPALHHLPAQNGGNGSGSQVSDSLSSTSIADNIREDSVYLWIEHDEKCAECQKYSPGMGPCGSPTADRARWLVHCVHSKQFSAEQFYDQVQKPEQARQGVCTGNDANSSDMSNTHPTANGQQSPVSHGNTPSGLVSTISNLLIPPQLLGQNFSLSLLQRIWKKELQIGVGDSDSDGDLLYSCIVLQKQIDHLNGNTEKIETPSIRMREIREEAEDSFRRIATARLADGTSNGMTNSSDTIPDNPCAICWKKEKRLACMPCGHLATCVPCSDSLRKCPKCQQEIKTFVRIYA